MTEQWKYQTVYQIYPRSFKDSTGNGVGDIQGIIEKLDYLQQLGIGLIWLSPVYKSPMADNGYDISDYQDIAEEFGSLEDFDQLLREAKARDIGIMMDLVVNHSSDEHAWFVDACSNRSSKFRDFYIWRDPAADGDVPNDLQSFFGGPAWTLHEPTGQYYLHLFDRKQPDLNWQNPQLRQAVYDMMNWWLDRGIAGFRMDVIDLIGKEIDQGITADGPLLHTYIREMHERTLAGRDSVTVGEAWSANTENALLYSGKNSKELSMVFQFEHVSQQWDEKLGKWAPKPFDLVALKRVFNRWQEALAEDGWNSLFWGNHDLPRAVSKYGNDGAYREESAKMLATVLHLMRGTPYVYQGEEFGMTNATFTRVDQLRDVESLNFLEIQTQAGVSVEQFMAGVNANGRDNARTPMQWNSSAYAGFSTTEPWIEVNPNYTSINAKAAVADTNSIFHYYRRLIELRRSSDLIVQGSYTPLLEEHPNILAYLREWDGRRMLVLTNFSDQTQTALLDRTLVGAGETLICNYDPRSKMEASVELHPYEALAFLYPV